MVKFLYFDVMIYVGFNDGSYSRIRKSYKTIPQGPWNHFKGSRISQEIF